MKPYNSTEYDILLLVRHKKKTSIASQDTATSTLTKQSTAVTDVEIESNNDVPATDSEYEFPYATAKRSKRKKSIP